MKLTFTAYVEVLDKAKYEAAVKKAIVDCFMKAAQKFLLAAIPRIPIWTGFARGAFRNLEDVAGDVTADAQSPSGYRIRSTKGGGGKVAKYIRRGYYYYPPGGGRVERTPQSGRQFATAPASILEADGATVASGKNAYYFRFDVNIAYFDKLDPAKWGAWKAGTEAFEAYVKANLKLPDPLKYMTRKLVS